MRGFMAYGSSFMAGWLGWEQTDGVTMALGGS